MPTLSFGLRNVSQDTSESSCVSMQKYHCCEMTRNILPFPTSPRKCSQNPSQSRQFIGDTKSKYCACSYIHKQIHVFTSRHQTLIAPSLDRSFRPSICCWSGICNCLRRVSSAQIWALMLTFWITFCHSSDRDSVTSSISSVWFLILTRCRIQFWKERYSILSILKVRFNVIRSLYFGNCCATQNQ